MDILLNGDGVDALSFIIHKGLAYEHWNSSLINSKIILASNLKFPIKRCWTQDCRSCWYQGPLMKAILLLWWWRSRKRKLLEKQKLVRNAWNPSDELKFRRSLPQRLEYGWRMSYQKCLSLFTGNLYKNQRKQA